MKPRLLALGVLFGATALNAHATLTSYIGAGWVGLVYSSESNVTWTQDANLFKTLFGTNNNLINDIAIVTSSYNDPYFNSQIIDADDFDTIPVL